MKTLTIKLHSAVDVITNSSTVIFTYVNSVDAVKEVMNAVLAGIEGCTVTAEELFDFEVVYDDDVYDTIRYRILDNEDEDNEHYINLRRIKLKYEGVENSWREEEAEMIDYLKKNFSKEDVESYGQHYTYFAPETRLLITPRFEGGDENLGNKLMNIFYHEATHDG